MRRIGLTIALFGTLAAPAQASPPAKVALTSCLPAERAAAFEARMGMVEDAVRLKMRFTLQVRKSDQKTYHRVAAPGFTSWTTAARGKTRWVYSRRINGLLGPARYRATVKFQWLDAAGEVVARAKRYSAACKQPDHRPNLKIRSFTREAPKRYLAQVVNDGRMATDAFDLQLAVGATLVAPVTVAGLEPGERAYVTLRGPVCEPGTSVTATADPGNRIDERSEDDNAFTIACE